MSQPTDQEQDRQSKPDRWTRVFVGLGSNLGPRGETVRKALAWIASHRQLRLVRHTTLIETAPWGFSEQPRFLNAVAEIITDLAPQALLAELKKAERALGRSTASGSGKREPGQRWGPREIDLDILLYGDEVIDSPQLIVPHPQLAHRSFVLEQILELDPTARHPKLGLELQQLYEQSLKKISVP